MSYDYQRPPGSDSGGWPQKSFIFRNTSNRTFPVYMFSSYNTNLTGLHHAKQYGSIRPGEQFVSITATPQRFGILHGSTLGWGFAILYRNSAGKFTTGTVIIETDLNRLNPADQSTWSYIRGMWRYPLGYEVVGGKVYYKFKITRRTAWHKTDGSIGGYLDPGEFPYILTDSSETGASNKHTIRANYVYTNRGKTWSTLGGTHFWVDMQWYLSSWPLSQTVQSAT